MAGLLLDTNALIWLLWGELTLALIERMAG